MSSDARKERGARRSVQKERFWRGQVRGHARSGLSVRAWCRQERLSEASFCAWRRELAKRDQQRPASATRTAAAGGGSPRPTRRAAERLQRAAFLPVTLTEPAGGHVELELPSGLVIRVPAQQLAALRAVWQLLVEQRPC